MKIDSGKQNYRAPYPMANKSFVISRLHLLKLIQLTFVEISCVPSKVIFISLKYFHYKHT